MLKQLKNDDIESIQYTSQPIIQEIPMLPFGNSPNLSLRPKFLKLFGGIFLLYGEKIFNYLSLIDLCLVRSTNKTLQMLIHDYYLKRLKIEIQSITLYANLNQDKTSFFMKHIDSQIPISKNNWLNFSISSVTETINESLSRNIITNLRSIKNLGKYSDIIYAPFCIIFGYNKSRNHRVKIDGWKKTAGKILNDANFFIKISKLDIENFNDDDILEAFVSLNSKELDIDVMKRYSPSLAKLIKWCQAVVSYHILIHPYTYRNSKGEIKQGSKEYEIAQNLNGMINRFYKFKRFLFNLGLVKIPIGDYVFNIEHSREPIHEHINTMNIFTEDFIVKFLAYIPLKERLKFIFVNKNFLKAFIITLDDKTLELFKSIYYIKFQEYNGLYKKIDMFKSSMFSQYFLMLDEILNSECDVNKEGKNYIPFLTKEQLNDIKKIKIENEVTITIMKVLCYILNVKPERRQNEKGVKVLYLQKIKTLAINGSLNRMMRNVDKLNLNRNQIKILSENMQYFYSCDKLQQIKKINLGLYQLLIWELYIYEYLKEFNPFDIFPIEASKLNDNEIELFQYYIEILRRMKYNLQAKFHFSAVNFNSNNNTNRCSNYDIKKAVNGLYVYANDNKEYINCLFQSPNLDHNEIAKVYNKSKDLIPQSSKPALYERIILEIIATSNYKGIEDLYIRDSDIKENPSLFKEENSINNIINTNLSKGKKVDNSINSNNINNNNHNATSTSLSNFNNNIQINNKPLNKIETVNFMNLENDLIIKTILFYLDNSSIRNFSFANRKCNKCSKVHMIIKLSILNHEKQILEEEHNELIQIIESKRNNFFTEYAISPPNQEHAKSLISQLTHNDIIELKQVFKKQTKTLEMIVAPLVVLMGLKPKSGIDFNGNRTIAYFPPAQKMICQRDIIKRIQQFTLEIISNNKFQTAEKLMKQPVFNREKINNFSPCLMHLIYWLMGVIEYHRSVRPFSLSYYDYDILDQNEKQFCVEMDNFTLSHYKMILYVNKYCKKYEKCAEEIMNAIE